MAGSSSDVTFGLEDPRSGDAQWCINEYFDELSRRFEGGFDPSLGISADPHELTPPAGAFFIARSGQRPVGCGGLKFHGDEPAELKRMWIAPAFRGRGLGRRLLETLETYALQAGVRRIRLETNGTLAEAISLYRRSGYLEVPRFNAEPYAHHWFEKTLSQDDAVEAFRELLRARLAVAIKDRDHVAAAALRSALGAIDNAQAVESAPSSEAKIGVGVGEVERRPLTIVEAVALVRGEITDRRRAAAGYHARGQEEGAARLAAEADVLDRILTTC